jgi:DNA-binding NarL/FixJ family response regulator
MDKEQLRMVCEARTGEGCAERNAPADDVDLGSGSGTAVENGAGSDSGSESVPTRNVRPSTPQVLLVGSRSLALQGIACWLEHQVGVPSLTAKCGCDALAQLGEFQPRVLIVLGDQVTGLRGELIRTLRAGLSRNTALVWIGGSDLPPGPLTDLDAAFSLESDPAELLEFLRSLAILPGPRRESRSDSNKDSIPQSPVDPRVVSALTEREFEVLELMAGGVTSNRGLADHLGVSENTAKFHVGNILGKLGMHKRAEIVAYALSGSATPHESGRDRQRLVG